jgi:hypothetical protein
MIINQQSLETFIPNFGIVSALYIGGQSAIDAVGKSKGE